MESELANDDDYIEACRTAAWCEEPMSKTLRYWDPMVKDFNFPNGWPEGVEPDNFIRERLEPNQRSANEELPPTEGPLSPSVRRLREMLK